MKTLIAISFAAIISAPSQATPFPDQKNEKTAITKWQKTNFTKMDANNNGSLDPSEFRGTTKKWMTSKGYSEDKQIEMTNKKFSRFDINKDQKVSLEELARGVQNEKQRRKRNQKN